MASNPPVPPPADLRERMSAKQWRTWLLFMFTSNAEDMQLLSDMELRTEVCRQWDELERRAALAVSPPNPSFQPGGWCPCGAVVKLAPGIGPFCSRTGIDAPCDPTEEES